MNGETKTIFPPTRITVNNNTATIVMEGKLSARSYLAYAFVCANEGLRDYVHAAFKGRVSSKLNAYEVYEALCTKGIRIHPYHGNPSIYR